MKTKADFDELVELVKKHIPSFCIKNKKDSWFQKFVGILLWPINQKYMTSYITVMFNTMWMPEGWEEWSYTTLYNILRHEFVHLLDAKRYHVWFLFSYLFVLPFVFTFRAHWEMRGYTQSLLVEYENDGVIDDGSLDWVAFQFTSSRYGWMNPFKKGLMEKLQKIREDIVAEKIKGLTYPYNIEE